MKKRKKNSKCKQKPKQTTNISILTINPSVIKLIHGTFVHIASYVCCLCKFIRPKEMKETMSEHVSTGRPGSKHKVMRYGPPDIKISSHRGPNPTNLDIRYFELLETVSIAKIFGRHMCVTHQTK